MENSENVYNQNFTGVYCTCKRPYPDPDCTEDVGEMLQCCVCEDWFHEVHLGLASADEVHIICNVFVLIYLFLGEEVFSTLLSSLHEIPKNYHNIFKIPQ